jgi:hypothetical protein
MSTAFQILSYFIQRKHASNQTIISTGFTPGVDDWEFTNFGSYISPGVIARSSISAMWYYYEKKLKGSGNYTTHTTNFIRITDKETQRGSTTNTVSVSLRLSRKDKMERVSIQQLLKIETNPDYHFLSVESICRKHVINRRTAVCWINKQQRRSCNYCS